MTKHIFALSLGAMLFALCFSAEAQQPKKVPRIGYLDYGAAIDRDEAFFQALRDLGWIEGKNIAIEYRWAEGKIDRLPALAKELVGLKVDLIVTWSRPVVDAAKSATTTIPIVMVRAADAVENRLVASLARPGGNVTGMSEEHADLHTKLLELIHETLPQAKRVAVLWNPASSTYTRSFKAMQSVAPTFKLTLQSLQLNHYLEAEVRSEKLEGVLEAAAKKRASALMVMPAMYDILGQRNCRVRNQKPNACVFHSAPSGGEALRPSLIYVPYERYVPARCDVRGQDLKGRQACRLTCGATEKVRASDQSQDGKTTRSHSSAVGAVPGG
jgi:ABC-type uncharacterized transport system substrate-binding protein